MTCSNSDPDCEGAFDGTGNDLSNNDFNMIYVDVGGDPTTFNSRTANLSLPITTTAEAGAASAGEAASKATEEAAGAAGEAASGAVRTGTASAGEAASTAVCEGAASAGQVACQVIEEGVSSAGGAPPSSQNTSWLVLKVQWHREQGGAVPKSHSETKSGSAVAETPRVRLGAHISGGLKGVAAKAELLGCEAVQVFASSPQMWRPPSTKPAEIEAFRATCAGSGLSPVAVHAIYLVNPASEKPEFREKTEQSLIATLHAADLLGADMVITHLGSALGSERDGALDRACELFARVLEAHVGQARLLFETSAGAGDNLGGTFEELGEMIRRTGAPPNLGACIDTAHVFTSGHDIRTADDLEQTLERFDRAVGLDRLGAIHLNDSKAPFGSNRDRHENLGDGEIGFDALARFVNHPALGDRPLFLEVPGYSKDGPDRPNMERLYAMVGRQIPEVTS